MIWLIRERGWEWYTDFVGFELKFQFGNVEMDSIYILTIEEISGCMPHFW